MPLFVGADLNRFVVGASHRHSPVSRFLNSFTKTASQYRSRARVSKLGLGLGLGLPSQPEHQNRWRRRRNTDPTPWFLNGFESRAPEQPASGEVDGDDDEDDKERTRLHRRCEIKKRGVLCRAMCQCRPPVAQEATGGGEE